MLKIGITTLGADGGKSGISQYTCEILRMFAHLRDTGVAADVTFEVIAHADEMTIFAPDSWGMEVVPVSNDLHATAKNLLWHQKALPDLCRQQRYDVLFLVAGNRRLPFHCPCPTVGVIHDFSILHVPGKYDALHHIYITRVLPVLCRQLTQVITVSESSQKDIVSFAKVPAERVTVIPSGADRKRFRPIPCAEARAGVADRYGLTGPYMLYVSRIEHPGKNHVRLIEAFAKMKRSSGIPHRLVLAGSDWNGAATVHDAAKASGVENDILFTGFAPADDLPLLYAAADATVFPSLYEGFGLPVLEAMQCGSAVACSNTSSLPEVGGDAVTYFDPTAPDDIARSLSQLLTDDSYRHCLQQRGLNRAESFSWEKSARQTLEVLRTAAKR